MAQGVWLEKMKAEDDNIQLLLVFSQDAVGIISNIYISAAMLFAWDCLCTLL